MKGTFHELPLRRQREYRLLWSARTVSITGSEVSRLAVPLTAVTLLAASPIEMGLLTAAASLPALLFGLQSGAIADRLRRHRPLMIGCELAAAGAALTVPAAWVLGLLTVPWLIAVALVIGTAGVLFRAANFPYTAAAVPPGQRTEALAGFQASYSVASVTGPGLAGALVQLLTAPFAVLVEGLSFLGSALLLRAMRTPEDHTPAAPKGLWREIREGLRASLTTPTLRALLGAGTTVNFFFTASNAVYLLYAVQDLGLSGGLLGALIAISGAGGLLGAWVTTRMAKRFGEDKVLRYSILLFPLDLVVVAAVSGPVWTVFAALATSGLIIGGAVVAFATCVGAVVLRDAPEHLRGRINATMTFAVQGVIAVGSVVGGVLGELIGLRETIWLSAAGAAFSILWIWRSPFRPTRPRPLPTVPGDAALSRAMRDLSLYKSQPLV